MGGLKPSAGAALAKADPSREGAGWSTWPKGSVGAVVGSATPWHIWQSEQAWPWAVSAASNDCVCPVACVWSAQWVLATVAAGVGNPSAIASPMPLRNGSRAIRSAMKNRRMGYRAVGNSKVPSVERFLKRFPVVVAAGRSDFGAGFGYSRCAWRGYFGALQARWRGCAIDFLFYLNNQTRHRVGRA